jgi:hypothetical protein
MHITKRANPSLSANRYREKISATGIARLTDFRASQWDFARLAHP